MTSEEVITEARAYADRIAIRMAETVGEREEFSKAAFLAYLQGFKAGLGHERDTLESLKREVRHD